MCIIVSMNKGITKTHKRVNITLPDETLQLLDRITERGERSRLIDEAVRFYAKEIGKSRLRRYLTEGAVKHAKRDLILVEDWFNVEEESWDKNRK